MFIHLFASYSFYPPPPSVVHSVLSSDFSSSVEVSHHPYCLSYIFYHRYLDKDDIGFGEHPGGNLNTPLWVHSFTQWLAHPSVFSSNHMT